MQDEFSHFTKHVITIIPNAIETQNFTIHLKKLLQFVKIARCLEYLQCLRLFTLILTWINRAAFCIIDFNSMTFQPILQQTAIS